MATKRDYPTDVTRKRRYSSDPAKRAYYARYRSIRFKRHYFG
jgi:hypothetical protein